ncbi:glycine N-acyltransferase-like [Syngnathus scovelli]|uniref:glycine N-acyltransferase-like n=1 Tax=Syngnathus scovelli TaxID=161590 RepID=UPI00210FAE35|nr:glycine N-acyltransferase-like [Syngnathus scovelli]
MIILKAFKDLTLMKDILHRELPQSVNVLGGLHHMLQNNVFQLKMCVDSWPTFSTAICFRQNQIGNDFKEINEKYSIFSKNQNSLRRLLTDDKLIQWRDGLEFEVANHHSQIVREIASLRGVHVAEDGGYHSYINYSPEKLIMSEKTSTLATSTLNESHVELVVQHLPSRGWKENSNLIEAYIKHLPNRCVVDEKGHPVSWVLTDEFNELTFTYSHPNYRRKGHISHLLFTLIQQKISEGSPVFCQIHKDNAASIIVMSKSGFIRGVETTYLMVKAEG